MLDQVYDDDVWADSDGESSLIYERNLAEREWERLQEDHGNTGYKEGIVEGKEVNMQKGFDEGYKEGLSVGKAIGKLRGLVSTQITFYQKLLKNEAAAKELESLLNEIESIEVNHIYCADYFRKDGPKDKGGYVAPEDFVRTLQDRVNDQLQMVSEKFSKRY